MIAYLIGEQLLLLARRREGGDGVWEAESETEASQQSWRHSHEEDESHQCREHCTHSIVTMISWSQQKLNMLELHLTHQQSHSYSDEVPL